MYPCRIFFASFATNSGAVKASVTPGIFSGNLSCNDFVATQVTRRETRDLRPVTLSNVYCNFCRRHGQKQCGGLALEQHKLEEVRRSNFIGQYR